MWVATPCVCFVTAAPNEDAGTARNGKAHDMRSRIRNIIAIFTTLVGTLLLTATGAIAWQSSGQEVPGGLRNVGPGAAGSAGQVPGGLRNVGPAAGPAHEIPGGLRNVGPATGDAGVEPATDAAVQATAGISLTSMLLLLALTAAVAAVAGYGVRAAQARRGTYVDVAGTG